MPATPLFLDTSGLFALLNASDSLHQHALSVWRQLTHAARPVLLSDFIVAETGNGLARTPARAAFPAAARAIARNPLVTLTFITPAILDDALSLYDARRDKSWGLVDCSSFLLMKREGITEAFTTDHHFEQAGFKCLLPATGG